jgi:hypothetical protein
MPLTSDHFTKPKRNLRLDACLVDDGAHIRLVTPRERGDHVSRIQAALFIILQNVNLEDELGTEEYGPLTAEAVFRFKNTQTPKILNEALHQTVPDNIVGKRTILALDKEMLARQGKTPADPKLTVTAVPLSGFSNLRLGHSGSHNLEGFVKDPGQPLCQMVPVERGFRNLFVTTGNKSDSIRMRIPDPPHIRTFIAPGVITVRGLGVGEDRALFTINGKGSDEIRLIVRAEAVITVNFFALADVKAGKGALGFEGRQAALIQGLDRIYGGQANIRFRQGQFKTIDTVNGRKIDFDKPIVVNPRIRNPNQTDPTRQFFTFGAFLPLATNPTKEINFFLTPGLVDAAIPKAVGTNSSIFDEKLCWGKTEQMKDPHIAARLVGHEIGHILWGFGHLEHLPGTLMTPDLKSGGDVIPAETLEELKIP